MRKLLVVFLLLFSTLCFNRNVWAQAETTTGSIQGTVVDEKGGAVPDASVEVKNLDTNLSKTTTTGSEGQYQFLALPPGRYTVTIAKAGFATVVEQNAVLTVGQTMSLPVTVKVSAAAEQIEIQCQSRNRQKSQRQCREQRHGSSGNAEGIQSSSPRLPRPRGYPGSCKK